MRRGPFDRLKELAAGIPIDVTTVDRDIETARHRDHELPCGGICNLKK
jgi:hypothetical protein